ncbi:hypothetical protein LTR91_005510 [Friedmanniomyces endolithicus]|uniref:SRR1-like domain-containing protein n=1 Tax=Friedmanniomyces endolithicus TaxID=329885 RepID=A0AAN6KTT1_9PEZI|nr:hypothetical protein LTR35_008481 [Friedmanniomyces endolithicus]KAK0294768.1 hypothetical protein LTS00_006603 [Friedmanniomyces endolithicus]KAK0322467.1 hypothetical protein LTR82_006426 [Friedmanniomyces endolithicus]KAK0922017.1 hypothetical protein LTR57_008161 [Friedmanniomyces endolithicus]KAK0972733.1 hypothetical protein LTS01_014807 [Friedmanniomyces endolithicus]
MPNSAEERVEGGWTRVGRGRGSAPKSLHGLAPPTQGLTLERLQADFEIKSKVWRKSTCRRETLAILDKQQPDAGWQIQEAVCLATNSFSRDNWQARQRSMMQWVAFFDITQHLKARQESPVAIFAQEPNYTALDTQFLQAIDVRVLDAGHNANYMDSLGEARQHVQASSFVFEAFMDVGVEAVRELFRGDPVLYIGSSVERWRETPQRSGVASTGTRSAKEIAADSDRDGDGAERGVVRSVAEFVGSRRSYRMPRFEEDPNIFDGLLIYWKEDG